MSRRDTAVSKREKIRTCGGEAAEHGRTRIGICQQITQIKRIKIGNTDENGGTRIVRIYRMDLGFQLITQIKLIFEVFGQFVF